MLDTRVTFRDGGPCANQGVRVLRVKREQQPGVFVYLCSNLAGFQGQPCTNELYHRFTVADAGGCSPEVACKYNIYLNLTNFNDSDADVYTIEVVFEPLGDTMQRVLQRRISLQIGPADITTGMYWGFTGQCIHWSMHMEGAVVMVMVTNHSQDSCHHVIGRGPRSQALGKRKEIISLVKLIIIRNCG